MSQSKNHKWALFYMQKLGWSVFPIDPKGKRPFKGFSWKEYQKRLPTEEEINEWWTKWPDANIALVTGELSGLSVIDIDEYKAPGTAAHMQDIFYQIRWDHHFRPWDRCYSSKTPRGGFHWFFEYHPALISRAALPNVDVKSRGGYVLLPPSTFNGHSYKWIRKPWKGKEKRRTIVCPEMYVDIFCENPTHVFGEEVISPESSVTHDENNDGNVDKSTTKGVTSRESRCVAPGVTRGVTRGVTPRRLINFDEGGRDETLFHIANQLFKAGTPLETIEETISFLAAKCNPPFKQWQEKIMSALDRDKDRSRPLSEDIADWVAESSGEFSTIQLDREVGVKTDQDRRNRRKIIQRLKAKKVIKQVNGKAGVYQRVESERRIIDYVNIINDHRYDNIVWPLGLEDFYRPMPKNIIIVAGAPDSGKTAFLLAFTEMNMENYPITYFSSEMGEMEFHNRLSLFPKRTITDWKFEAVEQAENFEDVIDPNGVNIIDYMELTDQFYRVGGYINNIFRKLDQGLAIIALQKNPGSENPLGGTRAREKARMVVNLDRVRYTEEHWGNEITITKCKNWAQPHLSPVGMACNFSIGSGCVISKQGDWRRQW